MAMPLDDMAYTQPIGKGVSGQAIAPGNAIKPTGNWFMQNMPQPSAPSMGAAEGTLAQNFGSTAPGGMYTGTFTPPNLNETTDPGYRFALDEQQRALRNSQFAQGQGLTGGSLRDLMSYQTGLSNRLYGDVFNRALQTQGFNRDTEFGNTDRALNTYLANRGTFWGDQDRLFDRNFSLANLGASMASGYGGQLGQYGASGSDIYTGIGNANASGAIGRGNAIAGGIQGGTSMAAYLAQLRQQGKAAGGIA